jgi:hydroxypyruvate reductase/glycerate 2-kinase
MSELSNSLPEDCHLIWQAALGAVEPKRLLRETFSKSPFGLKQALVQSGRIIVVGAGKAGAAMSAAIEELLCDDLDRTVGWVNVPAEAGRPLQKIHLHAARPAGTNQPTSEGVIGAERIVELVRSAAPDDLLLCLISGGGSALLPLPANGITLEEKQTTTRLLHASGATINEMNAVRKHLSRVKGGQLAQAFPGRALYSLIISDVIGDPLDVIASGPTAPDPTTFADALSVLKKYGLGAVTRSVSAETSQDTKTVPPNVLAHLEKGAAGLLPETPKELPRTVHNLIIGNNSTALTAAQAQGQALGYRVMNLGSAIEGETQTVARSQAHMVHGLRQQGRPPSPPVCILSGGETTVTLGEQHGLGGRNQELVLSFIAKVDERDLRDTVILSGGTDGEDGPTDAAGAIADANTLRKARELQLDLHAYLARHDAYHFFEAAGGLLKTGLTETNVMDVRVILVR